MLTKKTQGGGTKPTDNQKYINEFLKFCNVDKVLRIKSVRQYKSDLDEFATLYQDRDILKLKEIDIRNYKYQLVERKLAIRTINRKLSTIRTFYNYFLNSESHKTVTRNPVTNVKSIRLPKCDPIILSESQAETLLDGILLTGRYAFRDYAIFCTFLFTALRVSELINLKLSDLDFDNHVLRVVNGKGGKDRTVPMIPRLENALKLYLTQGISYRRIRVPKRKKEKYIERLEPSKCGRAFFIQPGVDDIDYVFLSQGGTKFSPEGVNYLFKEYAKDFGIFRERLSLHALRRSCLTFLYRQGVDLFILREISGHSNITTLQHYLRIDQKNVLSAMEKNPLAKQGFDLRLMDLVRFGK